MDQIYQGTMVPLILCMSLSMEFYIWLLATLLAFPTPCQYLILLKRVAIVFTYLLELWDDFKYFAEIIFKDRIASTAASSTSALFLIRPDKGRRKEINKILKYKIYFPNIISDYTIKQAATSRNGKTSVFPLGKFQNLTPPTANTHEDSRIKCKEAFPFLMQKHTKQNTLTNNQLSHIFPVQLVALLMDNSDCDSTLDSLVEFKTKNLYWGSISTPHTLSSSILHLFNKYGANNHLNYPVTVNKNLCLSGP